MKSPSTGSRSREAIVIINCDCVPRSEELPVRENNPPTVMVTSGILDFASRVGARSDTSPGANERREISFDPSIVTFRSSLNRTLTVVVCEENIKYRGSAKGVRLMNLRNGFFTIVVLLQAASSLQAQASTANTTLVFGPQVFTLHNGAPAPRRFCSACLRPFMAPSLFWPTTKI